MKKKKDNLTVPNMSLSHGREGRKTGSGTKEERGERSATDGIEGSSRGDTETSHKSNGNRGCVPRPPNLRGGGQGVKCDSDKRSIVGAT